MANNNDEYFAEVAANVTSSKTVIIPNGETWELQKFSGAAAYISDSKAMVVWDFEGAGEEVIYFTHGDGVFLGERQFAGDGVKKMAICLVNDSAESQFLGGQYLARSI